jgi:hypothetical protein
MIDRLEKTGRLVLWFTLAAACMLVVLGYAKQQESLMSAAASLHAAEQHRTEAKQKEEERGPTRLTIKSMGSAFSSFNEDRATGEVWFTNVSPRSGVVCVVGVATNPNTQQSQHSLASCEAVTPYATVKMKVMFAGGDLDTVCKGAKCAFQILDEPNAKL